MRLFLVVLADPGSELESPDALEAYLRALIEEPGSGLKVASEGVRLIAAERQRQISKEGYSTAHDDDHVHGELARAAAAYALAPDRRDLAFDLWPWQNGMNLHETPVEGRPNTFQIDVQRVLVKAGALIAAELDRLTRLKGKDVPRRDAGGRPGGDAEEVRPQD